MVLVGNKIDLENQRVITEKRGRKVYVHVYKEQSMHVECFKWCFRIVYLSVMELSFEAQILLAYPGPGLG